MAPTSGVGSLLSALRDLDLAVQAVRREVQAREEAWQRQADIWHRSQRRPK